MGHTAAVSSSRSLRSIALTSGVGVLSSVVLAVTVGGPMGIVFAVVAPLMVTALMLDRLLERRERAGAALRERMKRFDDHPEPAQWLSRRPTAMTWWQAGLELPAQRMTRLGARRVVARELEPGSGRKALTAPVVVDLTGGLDISAPVQVGSLVERALRLNRAQQYGPLEAAPALSYPGDSRGDQPSRWLLAVDLHGRGRLSDRLGPESTVVDFDVDVLADECEAAVRALESPTRVLSPADLDLFDHGPHALVSGVTGSGKTEFLISWLMDMAHRWSPESLAIAVIDFKGGGSFARLKHLPHLRHLVSDLDRIGLDAASVGLAALIRRRERLLALHGVADVAELPGEAKVPRAVIVVDEYRALIEEAPAFVGLFRDMAARGRALGIHLVLSTQRFTSTAGDALMANIDLRVVFRAGDRAESMALLGVSSASDGRLDVGRAFVRHSGQIDALAFAMLSDVDEAVFSAERLHSPLWLEPALERPLLSLGESSHEADAIALGVHDDQDSLCRSGVLWRPREQGLLLAIGGDVRLRHDLCSVIAAQCPGSVVLSGDAVAAWDRLEVVEWQVGLLVPECDALIARLPSAWREDFLDRLIARAHDLVNAGKPVFIGLAIEGRLSSALERLQLTRLNVVAVDRSQVEFEGRIMQVYEVPVGSPERPGTDADGRTRVTLRNIDDIVRSARGLITVAAAVPARWLRIHDARLRVISIEAFIAERYSIMASSSAQHFSGVIVDGCSSAEFRAMRLTHRALPPPSPGTLLWVDEHGSIERVTAPKS